MWGALVYHSLSGRPRAHIPAHRIGNLTGRSRASPPGMGARVGTPCHWASPLPRSNQRRAPPPSLRTHRTCWYMKSNGKNRLFNECRINLITRVIPVAEQELSHIVDVVLCTCLQTENYVK